MQTVPKLADLLNDPSNLKDLPPEAIPILRAELAKLDSLLLMRLTLPQGNGQGQADGDRLLVVGETARKLGTSKDWLYRHADTLPFTVRVGTKQVRFSEAGIDRFIRGRAGR